MRILGIGILGRLRSLNVPGILLGILLRVLLGILRGNRMPVGQFDDPDSFFDKEGQLRFLKIPGWVDDPVAIDGLYADTGDLVAVQNRTHIRYKRHVNGECRRNFARKGKFTVLQAEDKFPGFSLRQGVSVLRADFGGLHGRNIFQFSKL